MKKTFEDLIQVENCDSMEKKCSECKTINCGLEKMRKEISEVVEVILSKDYEVFFEYLDNLYKQIITAIQIHSNLKSNQKNILTFYINSVFNYVLGIISFINHKKDSIRISEKDNIFFLQKYYTLSKILKAIPSLDSTNNSLNKLSELFHKRFVFEKISDLLILLETR